MLEHIKGNRYLLTAYGVGDFAFELQKYILDGYSLDDSNEGYPTQYVGNFSCHLLKLEDKPTETRVGRKKKETE